MIWTTERRPARPGELGAVWGQVRDLVPLDLDPTLVRERVAREGREGPRAMAAVDAIMPRHILASLDFDEETLVKAEIHGLQRIGRIDEALMKAGEMLAPDDN